MKNWKQLFVRQGFLVEEVRSNEFDCLQETEENLAFLLECLENLQITFHYESGLLSISNPAVSEEEWLACLDFEYRGIGGDLWFRPGVDQPKIKKLDTYISGIVRQLNRLGLYTNMSCDGHGRGNPRLGFINGIDTDKVIALLLATGVPRIHSMNNHNIKLHISRPLLLEVAEKLSYIQIDWLEKGVAWIRKQLFFIKLEQLLSIPGESGNEEKIRQFVIEQLQLHVDYITVDKVGNILAQKQYGTGHGPTILVNAHLDTVDRIEEGRMIVKNGAIWSSDRGILGADDRAGIAVLLELAQRLQTSRFNGTVKYIFTVEEESGLIGARSVDETFLWGIDTAIVVDRRGTGDIVTSCGGYQAFCHENYGRLFEEAAKRIGLVGWKTTIGGSSDTRIWAAHGIQSVNLSVGYLNEHTSSETLDIEACYNTGALIHEVITDTRTMQRTLRQIEILKSIEKRAVK